MGSRGLWLLGGAAIALLMMSGACDPGDATDRRRGRSDCHRITHAGGDRHTQRSTSPCNADPEHHAADSTSDAEAGQRLR